METRLSWLPNSGSGVTDKMSDCISGVDTTDPDLVDLEVDPRGFTYIDS